MPITDFLRKKQLDVADVSDQPTISRTMCLKITGGDDSTTGTGEIVLDWSNIASKADIGVYDENDNLLDYYFETFDETEEKAVIWVFRDWVQDGSTQLQVAYGDGPSDQSAAEPWDVFGKETDLAAGYLFNETSGDLIDISDNGNHGTVYGAAREQDGIVGKAYGLDGSDDYIGGLAAVNDKYTIEIIFSSDESQDTDVPPSLWTWDRTGGSHDYDFRVALDVDTPKAVWDTDTEDGTEVTSDIDISHNVGNHLVVVQGTDTFKMFLNASEVGSASISAHLSGTQKAVIGRSYVDTYRSEHFFKGKISFVRYSTDSFTADEITALYSATKSSPDFFSQQAGEDISTVIDIPLASISTRPLHASYGPIFVPLARISTDGLRPFVGGIEEAISIPIAHLRSTVHDPGILWAQQIPKANISASGRKPTPHIELIVPRSRVTVQGRELTINPRIVVVPLSHISANAHDFVLGWEQLIPQAYISTDIHDPYAFSGFSIPLVGLRTAPLRPRQYWTPDPTEAQTIYQFVLTGSADGEDDVTIPISSCQMRRRDGKPTYMSVNVPNYDDYADEILARPNGEMVLKKGVRFNDGTKQLQEIARVEMEMENLRMDKGPNSRSITLTGHKTVSTTDPNKVTISGVSYRNYSGGLRRYRCEVDLWLKPGDLVVIPEENEEFEVGYISYTIGPREQRMEIKEAE